jgi:hypothetical protein
MGVLIYLTLLVKFKYFNFEVFFFTNLMKIVISLVIMTLALYFSINFFEDKLIYSNYYKSFYLIMIVAVAAGIYLSLARLLGVFKIRNFITN